jgi:hypothetical protein
MLLRLSIPVNISLSRGLHRASRPAPSLTPAASQSAVLWSRLSALWPTDDMGSLQHSDTGSGEACSSSSSGGVPGPASRAQPRDRPVPGPRLPKGLSKLHLQVMHTIRSRELIQPEASILIAVSGGQVRRMVAVTATVAGDRHAR